MMQVSPIDLEQYDLVATKITYYKLFPYIMEDFITREDSKELMKSSNIPVTTRVTTLVNTAVQVAIPAGTGTGVGAGNGQGSGNATPIYNGSVPSPNSYKVKAQRKAQEEAGGATIEGLTSVLKTTAGF